MAINRLLIGTKQRIKGHGSLRFRLRHRFFRRSWFRIGFRSRNGFFHRSSIWLRGGGRFCVRFRNRNGFFRRSSIWLRGGGRFCVFKRSIERKNFSQIDRLTDSTDFFVSSGIDCIFRNCILHRDRLHNFPGRVGCDNYPRLTETHKFI